MSHDDAFHSLLTGGALGVLVTLKRDGRPQLSTVGYDYDSGRRVIRVSVTDDRAKTRNLRRVRPVLRAFRVTDSCAR